VTTINPTTPREAPPEHEPPLPRALAGYTGFLVGKLRQRSLEIGIARTAAVGIQPRHFGVLTVLAEEGPRAQQDLADVLLVNRTMMVGVVDELEAAGLVERRRNPADRRAYALELTDAGRAALARATPLIEAGEEELLAALTPPERRRLVALLGKVVLPPGASGPPALSDRVGYLLALGEKHGLATVQAALGEIDLRVAGMGVLAVLDDEGAQSQRALATSLRVNRSVMVQVVDELEAGGLVERRRNPADRRAYALELTPAGRERIAQAHKVLTGVHDTVFGSLSARERKELHALLLRVVDG
jgi:DNA-binding MarR family transcriptional regulator